MAKKGGFRETFFLFKIVPTNAGLKKDEITLVSRIMYTAVAILVIIDIIAILFYVKTNNRLEALSNHQYTQDISKNLKESRSTQQEHLKKAKKVIVEKQTNLRSLVKRLEFDNVSAEKLNVDRLQLKTIDDLIFSFADYDKDRYKSAKSLQDLVIAYESTENELVRMNNYLMPITELDKYNTQLELYLKDMLKQLKESQEVFNNQIEHLQNRQADQTFLVEDEVKATYADFTDLYKNMVRANKYKKINNFYKVKFMEFDQNYVPYNKEYSKYGFGCQLTESKDFHLSFPRLYYCNLSATVRSDMIFEVAFQYVDKKTEDEEVVVFESDVVTGKYLEGAVYNNFITFTLPSGFHKLYLRTISKGAATSVRMSGLMLECLSYRNLNKKDTIVFAETEDDAI